MARGSSASTSSCISAWVQSMVSATPGSLNSSISRSLCTKPTTSRDSASDAPGALTFKISSSRSAEG